MAPRMTSGDPLSRAEKKAERDAKKAAKALLNAENSQLKADDAFVNVLDKVGKQLDRAGKSARKGRKSIDPEKLEKQRDFIKQLKEKANEIAKLQRANVALRAKRSADLDKIKENTIAIKSLRVDIGLIRTAAKNEGVKLSGGKRKASAAPKAKRSKK